MMSPMAIERNLIPFSQGQHHTFSGVIPTLNGCVSGFPEMKSSVALIQAPLTRSSLDGEQIPIE